ncbi:mRNA decay protein [Coemansia javaensis]|uniref:mRNA decay protein n=1 Tax=Coemansia javaensis TaxID=2761396 RepID=A0A9W8HA39_9FUNG|nr:mRNA decay protein [Coemansia javaensis]
MDESTLKRHDRLRGLQRSNVAAWCGRGVVLDATGLDANMKRHLGFIKRCKTNLGPEGAAQIVHEVGVLKLEKYISEIVPAVLEGMLRCRTGAEFAAAIDVASALHARFAEQFTVPLACQTLRLLQPPSIAALAAMLPEQREREEQARLARQRVALRALAEMYLAGLLWGIDAQPGGAGGVTLASALLLSHPGADGGSGSAGAARLVAKAKETAQQPGHCVLVGALQNLLLADREQHLSMILATAFAKAFRAELALGDGGGDGDGDGDGGACSASIADAPGAEQAPAVSADACQRIRAILHEYMDSALERLKTVYRGLVRMRESNEERLFSKGVVHADAKARLERQSRAFEKLNDGVTMLCDALGCAPPHLEAAAASEDGLGISFDGPATPGAEAAGAGSQWEDDEERVFYVSLLDLSSRLPPSMLGLGGKRQASADGDSGQDDGAATPQGGADDGSGGDAAAPDGGSRDGEAGFDGFGDIEASLVAEPEDMADGDNGGDSSDDDGADGSVAALGILEYQKFISRGRGSGEPADDSAAGEPAQAPQPRPPPRSGGSGGGGGGGGGKPRPAKAAAASAGEEAPAEGALTIVQQSGSSSEAATHMTAPATFAQIVRRLPTLTTKDQADQAAVDFCYVNTRANRRALVSVLLDAPRRQTFVIPLYSRFLATLHPYFPEIGDGVVEELMRDFAWLARKRFKGLLDARLKNARYIAELTKFGVAPLYVSFRCAKVLLDQFGTQSIEVLCALLGACGRFLRAQPQTAGRVAALLEVLVRKRRATNLDDRTLLLIENACAACQLRRAREARPTKYRTPYERYIRKLVYEDLAPGTAGAVCQRLRRLPWSAGGGGDDPQRVRRALVGCFAKVWKIKHANIPLMAQMLAALGQLHPWFRVAVVDAVMESIKLGLERNMFEHSQRRIAEASYVGEMLRCGVIGTGDALGLVHLVLAFGHRAPVPLPGCGCELDPPSSYFRIRLVCALLLAAGPCVRAPAAHRALADLSLHVQMYILAKDQPLPVDIDYNVDSLFESGFAEATRYGTWDEAARAAVAAAHPTRPVAASIAAVLAELAAAGPVIPLTPEPLLLAESGTSPGSDVPGDAGAPDAVDGEAAEEDEEEEDEDEDEDEEAQRQQQAALEALLEQEEEDALEREFNRLMLESTDTRRGEHGGKLDVAVPMSLIGRALSLRSDGADANSGTDSAASGGEAIRFSLLTGKKQRTVVHSVDIPTESQIAKNLLQQEEAAMREKAQLKRIVLDYERRSAEEEVRQYERELASRRAAAAAAAAAAAGGGATATMAQASDTGPAPAPRRAAVPGATFVGRRARPAAAPRAPGIPDRFL